MKDQTNIKEENIIERIKSNENQNNIKLMKKGDYTVHVLIEEVKNLKVKKENYLPKPIVKIKCFNKDKRTSKPPYNCEAYTYNEHLYFDETDLSVDILDSSKIILEVYDYHDFNRENYFGIQEFDFEYIYSKENHCIKNTWIALANPESEDITQINGYLKLSICILSTEDEKIELNPDPNNDSDYILPPQIKTTYKQLEIYLFKGEQFPDMEATFSKEKTVNKRCEACVEIQYLGIKKNTEIIKMKNEIIEWNELVEIPVAQPIISQKIKFIVKDKNNNIIGSFEILIDDILNKKYENLACVNIYGTLKAVDNSKEGKIMNNNTDIGSRWKGRIYLKINYKDINYPIARVEKIKDNNLITSLNKIGRKYLWSLYVKLYSAEYLPTDNGKYNFKISIQENSEKFVEKEALNKRIDWNICKSFAVQTFTQNLEELPDLIIYLMQKDKEICFQRIKLKNFYLNDDILVIKLFPEPCIKEINEIFYSGIVKLKIKLFNKNLDEKKNCDISAFKDGDEFGKKKLNIGINDLLSGVNFNNNNDDDEDLENLLKQEKDENINNIINTNTQNDNNVYKYYTIIACVYMTRYLISGDSNGLSDPYCKITIDGETKQTSIKYKCVNGIWNEKLIFDTVSFNYKEKATWPVMLITVMDKDINSSDMLGYSYLWLNDTNYSYNELKRIKPKWEQLYLKKSNRAQGQILLSFIILDNEHRNIIKNINIEPETIPYNVEINALGLRDLKPLTFIKIKKPFISFDLNSINVSNINGESMKPISTIPNDTGKNPNINSVIKFNVKLPKDEIFIPEFQCDVYDYVLAGLSKRILGIFLIDLRQIIRETKRHYQEEYEEAEKVMKILQDKEIQRQSINTKININEINGINTSKENINNDLIDTMIQKPQIKKNKDNNLFLCYYPSDLKKIYKGKINNDILEREKHNSEYFVLKPSFKKCVLPNKLRKKLEKMNNLENNELDEDYLIEDSENIPNLELYFPLGFNKNENPFKLKDKSKTDINLINNDDEEKEIFINNKENEFNNNNKKHYRRIYRKELENVKELNLGAPFIKCHLLRNKYEDTQNSLNDLLEAIKDEKNKIIKRFKHKVSEKNGKLRAINNLRMNYIETDEELMRSKELIFDLRNYGYFKGLIRISPKSLYDEHMNYIQSIKDKYKGNLPSELSFLTAFDELGKNIIIKRNIIVRIYILELNNLSRRDLFSESDPYIKILLGDKLLINEQKKALKNQRNCKWYKSYDIKLQLPGSSKLRIQAMDYDTLFSDDLIGETSIDIEDRYFDNRWQSLVNKPIEVRQLYHPDYDKSQGEVMLWIDMFSQNEEYKMEKWNIEPEPKNKMEMRLIIYETEGMENLDIEDTSDIYVMAFIDEKNKGQTDIHYRCSTGKASFNWRMIIPIDIPRDKYNLTIQVFDNDIFSKDDYICGGTINIYQILNDANILDIPLQLNEDYYSCLPKEQQKMSNVIFAEKEEEEDSYKFWVQLEKQGKKGGRVLCSLEIVPQWYAELHPVGKGRDEPNMNPYLPPPIGRIKFTWNPFKILNQLTGPKFRKKCYCIVCVACLLIYLIFLIPYLVYFISGEVINPFNY